jgi:fructokinase
MSDVIALGEILADFVPDQVNKVFGKVASRPSDRALPAGLLNMRYVLRPGGAPANVAVNLSRRGIKSAVIGKLGNDFLGDFLLAFLKNNHVNTSLVSRTKMGKTGLVFVFVNKYKDRDFCFYGEPSADKYLAPADVNEGDIKNCKVLHFGSIGMMGTSSAAATLKAICLAKKHGKIVSFDPNVRLNLWEGKAAEAKEKIRGYFKYADVVKISDTELKFLFNSLPEKNSIKRIFGKKLVFVSAGARGCYVFFKSFFKYVPGYKANVIDSTGAGDAFMAGILAGILKTGKKLDLNQSDLIRVAKQANKRGSEAVRHKGAV